MNTSMPGDGALTVTIEPATGLRPRLPGSNRWRLNENTYWL
ncbi:MULTISPECIES: hypothetical protein [Niastella]|nr:hypothetical protein [Niastella soli]